MTVSLASAPIADRDRHPRSESGMTVRSLPAIAAEAALRSPDRVVLTALDRAGQVAQSLTAGQVHQRSRALAASLARVAAPGDRVLVPAMPGLQFHLSFLACLSAGCVAVPVPAIRPGGLRRLQPGPTRRLGRLLTVCADCGPTAAFVPAEHVDALAELAAQSAELAAIRFLAAEPTDGCDELGPPTDRVDPQALAFLQYTSGSTSDPRGVMVSHCAMLANQRLIRDELDVRPDTVVVSWLPLYHDMGLCAGLLQPLFAGARAFLMEPETFLLRPERWLAALSGHADAVTAAPDFAYAMAVKRVLPELRSELDLRGWRVALCGAEPVKSTTLSAFSAAFGGSGFPASALTPAYGLAEATLYVCGADAAAPPVVRRYDRTDLGRGLATRTDAGDAVELVSVGRPAPEVEIVVVDPETGRALPPGRTGEIWLRSPSNGIGYWGQPEISAGTFGAAVSGRGAPDWLRTGDLGFVDGEDLFVAGRLKELIIIRGVNYYPDDFERLAQEAHPLLATGLAAAFSDQRHPDRVVIVIEGDRTAKRQDLADAALAAVGSVTQELPVQTEVIMVGAIQIPRTTSGKVRRRDCARSLFAGELTVLASSAGHVQ